jgi:hypothetical protein
MVYLVGLPSILLTTGMNPLLNPPIDTGILLPYGSHSLNFKPRRIPDRVYTCLVGSGGASCGTTAQGDYATIEIMDDSFVVNAVVNSDSATLFVYEFFFREVFAVYGDNGSISLEVLSASSGLPNRS